MRAAVAEASCTGTRRRCPLPGAWAGLSVISIWYGAGCRGLDGGRREVFGEIAGSFGSSGTEGISGLY